MNPSIIFIIDLSKLILHHPSPPYSRTPITQTTMISEQQPDSQHALRGSSVSSALRSIKQRDNSYAPLQRGCCLGRTIEHKEIEIVFEGCWVVEGDCGV